MRRHLFSKAIVSIMNSVPTKYVMINALDQQSKLGFVNFSTGDLNLSERLDNLK